MRLKYLDGSEDTDELFARPEAEQRHYMAGCLNMHSPEDDPELIDRMLAVRRLHGKKRFYREAGQILSPRQS